MASTGTLKLPLLVVAGPTASGKTSLAIEVASDVNGEIICADSRTVYKDMDIGTAKPSQDEMGGVPHWGIDLVKPNERFTAQMFQQYAKDKIADIRSRGHVPILAGGTGLYIDSIIYDYQFPPEPSNSTRQAVEAMTQEELVSYSSLHNIPLPSNRDNLRHVAGAVLRAGDSGHRSLSVIADTIVVGISTEREQLYHRIEQRAEQIFQQGIVEEANRLGNIYGWDNEAMTGNIYPILRQVIEGRLTQTEARKKFVIRDRQLAKRQMTWFRRNPWMVWGGRTELANYLRSRL